MLMQNNGVITEYLFLEVIVIIVEIRTAAAQAVLEMFAISETKSGVKTVFGEEAQSWSIAQGAVMLTEAAQYARVMFATETIEDGAQTAHGLQ